MGKEQRQVYKVYSARLDNLEDLERWVEETLNLWVDEWELQKLAFAVHTDGVDRIDYYAMLVFKRPDNWQDEKDS